MHVILFFKHLIEILLNSIHSYGEDCFFWGVQRLVIRDSTPQPGLSRVLKNPRYRVSLHSARSPLKQPASFFCSAHLPPQNVTQVSVSSQTRAATHCTLFVYLTLIPSPLTLHTSSRGIAGPGVDQLPKPNCLLPLTRSPICSSSTKATSVFNFTGIDVVNLWRNGWDRHAQRCSFSMYYTLHSPPASPSEEGGSKSSSL